MPSWYPLLCFYFFFNDTATTEIYTLSLHDALPIYPPPGYAGSRDSRVPVLYMPDRSEEHTSELQSRSDLVCRLLLEKKKKRYIFSPFSQTKRLFCSQSSLLSSSSGKSRSNGLFVCSAIPASACSCFFF